MSDSLFYHIGSRSRNGPDVDIDWVNQSIGKIFCERCRSINRSMYPAPVDIVLHDVLSGGWTIGSGFQVGVPIFRCDFIELLWPHMHGYVRGRCLRAGGGVHEHLVTLYAEKWVLMRGDERSRTEVCSLCGSIWTDLVMVRRGRPAYLLRHQLSGDLIYQDCDGDLFIAKSLAESLDFSKFRDLRFEPVTIRDTPLDGRRLPGDPDWTTMAPSEEDQRVSLAPRPRAIELRRRSRGRKRRILPESMPTECVARLVVRGATLDVEWVTAVLGCQPTRAQRLGEALTTLTPEIRTSVGLWMLESGEAPSASLERHLRAIMDCFPAADWHLATATHEVEMLATIYRGEDLDTERLPPDVLRWFGERNIPILIDWRDDREPAED